MESPELMDAYVGYPMTEFVGNQPLLYGLLLSIGIRPEIIICMSLIHIMVVPRVIDR
jgi:hypothetical protein